MILQTKTCVQHSSMCEKAAGEEAPCLTCCLPHDTIQYETNRVLNLCVYTERSESAIWAISVLYALSLTNLRYTKHTIHNSQFTVYNIQIIRTSAQCEANAWTTVLMLRVACSFCSVCSVCSAQHSRALLNVSQNDFDYTQRSVHNKRGRISNRLRLRLRHTQKMITFIGLTIQ